MLVNLPFVSENFQPSQSKSKGQITFVGANMAPVAQN
jgi:hypothetical protein